MKEKNTWQKRKNN